ncbi:aminoacyl-tRNA hydrolase [Patescibacteria group bacterium]
MKNIDLSDIKLIIGLGNPGPKFSNTRHNVGEMIVRKWAEGLDGEVNKKLQAELFRDTDITLAIPQTFMNHSGQAVAAIANFYKIKPEEILVIHDELDLFPGQYKFKPAGGASGHNGLRSIISELGSDQFKRIRIGIGRPFPHKPTNPAEQAEISKYVLSKFTKEEKASLDEVIAQIIPE